LKVGRDYLHRECCHVSLRLLGRAEGRIIEAIVVLALPRFCLISFKLAHKLFSMRNGEELTAPGGMAASNIARWPFSF
jgi:hypothetical protein